MARFINDASVQASRESAAERGDGGDERFSLVKAKANLVRKVDFILNIFFLNETIKRTKPVLLIFFFELLFWWENRLVSLYYNALQ